MTLIAHRKTQQAWERLAELIGEPIAEGDYVMYIGENELLGDDQVGGKWAFSQGVIGRVFDADKYYRTGLCVSVIFPARAFIKPTDEQRKKGFQSTDEAVCLIDIDEKNGAVPLAKCKGPHPKRRYLVAFERTTRFITEVEAFCQEDVEALGDAVITRAIETGQMDGIKVENEEIELYTTAFVKDQQ